MTLLTLPANNSFLVFLLFAGVGSAWFVRILLQSARDETGDIRKAPAVFILAAPFVAFAVYLAVGAFGMPDAPYALAQSEREARLSANQDFALLQALQAKLDRGEGDYRGRILLARGFTRMNEPEQAKIQYQKAITESRERDLAALGEYAEFLTDYNQGRVPPYAEKTFYKIAAQTPDDFRAGYYIGLSHLQGGRKKAAAQKWAALLQKIPAEEENRRYREKIKIFARQYRLSLPAELK